MFLKFSKPDIDVVIAKGEFMAFNLERSQSVGDKEKGMHQGSSKAQYQIFSRMKILLLPCQCFMCYDL